MTSFTFTGNKCYVYDLYHYHTLASMIVDVQLYSKHAKYVREINFANTMVRIDLNSIMFYKSSHTYTIYKKQTKNDLLDGSFNFASFYIIKLLTVSKILTVAKHGKLR